MQPGVKEKIEYSDRFLIENIWKFKFCPVVYTEKTSGQKKRLCTKRAETKEHDGMRRGDQYPKASAPPSTAKS